MSVVLGPWTEVNDLNHLIIKALGCPWKTCHIVLTMLSSIQKFQVPYI
jgi:hypothetical protein